MTFQWKYVLFPGLVLVLALALVFFYYGQLPPSVAYHFDDGTPDRWASRLIVLLVVLVPQFVAAGAALAVVGIIVMLARKFKGADTRLMGLLTMLMGNMMGLPQVVLIVAMLDIITYNVYGFHVPFLITSVLVMVLGIIIFTSIFMRAFRSQGLKCK